VPAPALWRFCPAASQHSGFNDLKIIEVAELLEAYANGCKCTPDFNKALAVQWTVEAIARSAKSSDWQIV